MQSDEQLKTTYSVFKEDDLIKLYFLEQVIDSDENVRRAELAREAVYALYAENKDKEFKVLVDMTRMGESHISRKAHKIYLDALKHPQTKKVAIVGNFKKQLKVLSFITPFIVGEGKKVTWFANEPEAMLWFEKV